MTNNRYPYKMPSTYKQVLGTSFADTVKVGGKDFIVGDKVLKSGNHLWDLDSLKKYTPVFLKYLKDIKNEDISKIVLSVPTSTFKKAVKQKEKNPNTITYFDEMTQQIQSVLPEVQDIRFLPQGVSAIYYYLENNEIAMGDRVLTIDGGFNTLNLALTDVQTPLDMVLYESMFDMGIRSLLIDQLLPLLQETVADDIPKDFHFLKKVFLSGEIDMGMHMVDVRAQIQDSVELYIDNVMEFVQQTVKRTSDGNYNVINIVGGIGYYLKDRIKTEKKIIVSNDKSEYMTTKGMAAKYPGYLSLDLGFGDAKIDRV